VSLLHALLMQAKLLPLVSEPHAQDLEIEGRMEASLEERIGNLAHIEKGAFAFLNIGPDLRRGTGPLRFSLPCLGFLFPLGASRGDISLSRGFSSGNLA